MNSELSNIDISHFSKEQKDIVECIGIECYYKLSLRYGGTSIYIGKSDYVCKQQRDRMIINDYKKGQLIKNSL